MSTKPGVTSAPSASISRVAVSSIWPTATIVPSDTPTSAVRLGSPVPSMSVPPRMIRSNIEPPLSVLILAVVAVSCALVTAPSDTATEVRLDDLEAHRRELTGYCYRMLGSNLETEDAVQETLVRAWKASDAFEGRSSVRSWLYRIATNVCLDMLRSRQRRATPMDMGPPGNPDTFKGD